MNNTFKKIVLAIFVTASVNAVQAQIKITQSLLSSAVELFLTNDNNLKSEIINTQKSSREYAVAVSFQGAIQSKVIEYFHPANQDKVIGKRFQTIFAQGATFTDAKVSYEKILKSLIGKKLSFQGTAFSIDDKQIVISDSKPTSAYYEFGGNKRLVVSIDMFQKHGSWTVELNMYELQKIAD